MCLRKEKHFPMQRHIIIKHHKHRNMFIILVNRLVVSQLIQRSPRKYRHAFLSCSFNCISLMSTNTITCITAFRCFYLIIHRLQGKFSRVLRFFKGKLNKCIGEQLKSSPQKHRRTNTRTHN